MYSILTIAIYHITDLQFTASSFTTVSESANLANRKPSTNLYLPIISFLESHFTLQLVQISSLTNVLPLQKFLTYSTDPTELIHNLLDYNCLIALVLIDTHAAKQVNIF